MQTRRRATPALEDEEFDVAISFAGAQRPLAEELATLLQSQGIPVFYDRFFGAQLWGTSLPEKFDSIFRRQAKYCVMFVSPEYRDGLWTTLERRSAIARAIEDRGDEYILPIMVEQVDLPGMPPTIGYVSIDQYSIRDIAGLLISKL